MSSDVTVSPAEDTDAHLWDAFVASSPDGRFFHRFGWGNVAQRAYGYQSCSLIARRGDNVVGILPLVDVKSPLLGRNLISTAFTVGGGIVAEDENVAIALAKAARREGEARNVKYVELRSEKASLTGWATKEDVYAGFEQEIPADEDENLKIIPRKRRAEVRKALKSLEAGALTYKISKDIDIFYSLYGEALRDHGTPIFSKKFARALVETFHNETEIIEVYAGDEPVLALLTFYGHGRTMPYYFGARRDARQHRAFDLAVWLQMRRAIELDMPLFDFGRSKFGTGSFDFKQYWGFKPTPLEYQYALIKASDLPNVNPNNPKFALVSKLWTKLPVPVANFGGPILARHLA